MDLHFAKLALFLKSRIFKCDGEVKQNARVMPGHCFASLHWASTPTRTGDQCSGIVFSKT